MNLSVKFEVWGDYALFSRPEFKVERCSYDVITPSAARGILEAVYWHPGLRYKIDRIWVLNPIKFDNIRRNEVKSKIPYSAAKSAAFGGKMPSLVTSSDIQQRASTLLRDVHYVIEAHFEMTDKANSSDNECKFCDTIRRRLEQGKTFHQPYFGCREFPANIAPFSGTPKVAPELMGEKDLGYMLYDMDFSDPKNIRPQFFRAVMKDGLIDLRDCEVKE